MSESAPYTNQPPDALDVLARILEQRRRLPACMPPNAHQSARWWMNMQKSMSREEWPHQNPIARGDGMRWDAPYIDRLRVNMQKFLTLLPADQEFIIGAKEDGCWWNGDEMAAFRWLYDETMEMRDVGAETYIANISATTRGIIKGFRGGKIETDPVKRDRQFQEEKQRQLNALQEKLDLQS